MLKGQKHEKSFQTETGRDRLDAKDVLDLSIHLKGQCYEIFDTVFI